MAAKRTWTAAAARNVSVALLQDQLSYGFHGFPELRGKTKAQSIGQLHGENFNIFTKLLEKQITSEKSGNTKREVEWVKQRGCCGKRINMKCSGRIKIV